jgi:YfiH family protein
LCDKNGRKKEVFMLRKESLGLVSFEFELFQSFPNIKHGCFSRKGGISSPPFDSLNVQYFPEENAAYVMENRLRIQKNLGISAPLIDLEQVHKTDIAIISSSTQEGEFSPEKLTLPLGKFDAVITDVPHVGLMIKHADCQACLIYDPNNEVIAAIHCGWRGNVQNIYGKVVEKLVARWGSSPESLIACVTPSLGPCHAEFKAWKIELPESFWKFQISENHFDLWSTAEEQLLTSGIRKNHIEIARICTYEEKDFFFSFRREPLTGRNATCIVLEPVQNLQIN